MNDTFHYRYLEDIAPADAAFEARGDTEEEMIIASVDALMNVMVENLDGIGVREGRSLHVEAKSLEMLLFHLLEELIFLKDAEGLFLRVLAVRFSQNNNGMALDADVCGEEIDPAKHDLNVDVKAVTLHRFGVKKDAHGWTATVVLDI